MSFTHYSAKLSMRPSSPEEIYKTHLQALINDRWDNTTTLYKVWQETNIGDFEFKEIEVHLVHAIEKSVNIKQASDFREIIFKDIEYDAPRGLYYYFDNNYWLTFNSDQLNRTSKNLFVRRCNNTIKVIDKYDGHIIELPCIIDYDIGASSPQVDNEIITPNNHPVIIMQGNDLTKEFVEQNTRFILNGRPFKMTGFNTSIQIATLEDNAPIIFIDAFQDEVSPYDDLENNIAFNYDIDYKLEVYPTKVKLKQNEEFVIETEVYMNDDMTQTVQRPIKIEVENDKVAQVVSNNRIRLIGEPNSSTRIKVQLNKNKNIYKYIEVNVVETTTSTKEIKITPTVIKVKQYDSVKFNVEVYENNAPIDAEVSVIPNLDSSYFDLHRVKDGEFEIKCLKPSQTPLVLTVVSNELRKNIAIDLLPMF